MPSHPARRRLLAATLITGVLATLVLFLAPAPALAGNGCGPAGFGALVPDRPLGFDFRAACDRHDDCSTTPWRQVASSRDEAKRTCDDRFLGDLDDSCAPEADRRLDLCFTLADDYHRAVRSWLGELAYARAQA